MEDLTAFEFVGYIMIHLQWLHAKYHGKMVRYLTVPAYSNPLGSYRPLITVLFILRC